MRLTNVSQGTRGRAMMVLIGLVILALLTWVWKKTNSLNPEEHARVDSALRELRSLDRTINQDVLRARYQLIQNYDPVLKSYRRIEELESTIATPPAYLDVQARAALGAEVRAYGESVTRKQALIEKFKYREADLRELLAYLPGAGTGVAKAASESGDDRLALDVNRVLQQTLLYNLTSDEKYAPIIRGEIEALSVTAERNSSHALRGRVRTLVFNIRTLLDVKPTVDHLLTGIFDEPITLHEDRVAAVYYARYAAVEHAAGRYRMLMYGLSIALALVVGYGVRRLQQTAKALALANERLEERVAERTRELDVRNREMRLVLDNVDQALFTVDMEGRISRERSAALDRWFPEAVAGEKLWAVFSSLDPSAAAWLSLGWEQLQQDLLPLELVLHQMPKTLTGNGRHYAMTYRPIGEEGALEKLLLVVSDVTDIVEREKRDKDQQEQLVIFRHMMRDRAGFLEFFEEGERLVEVALAEDCDRAVLRRALHTLKGNAGQFGVTSVSGVCHTLESEIADGDSTLAPDNAQSLVTTWTQFAEKVRDLAGGQQENLIELRSSDMQGLREAILLGKSGKELLRLLREVEREPAEKRLDRIADQAKSLARRLGKGDVEVVKDTNGVRLDGKRWAPFWAAFVHMLRNALDHGIEPADERVAAGKPEIGKLHVRIEKVGDRVLVEIRDDGRGIDWDDVRTRGQQLNLAVATQEDLQRALFQGGLSTKETVTEFSGRGTGISACRNACLDLGGDLLIDSRKGAGATFRFYIPGDDSVMPSVMPLPRMSQMSPPRA